jgi:hypothetical protein
LRMHIMTAGMIIPLLTETLGFVIFFFYGVRHVSARRPIMHLFGLLPLINCNHCRSFSSNCDGML